MKKLRETAKTEIIKSLDSHDFSSHNFEVAFEKDEDILVEINFLINPQFYFKIIENRGIWKTHENPGNNFLEEEIYTNLRDYNSCKTRISSWLKRLSEEMKISHININAEFQRLRDEINQKIEELNLNGTEPFSEEEKESWSDKLDDLYRQINDLKDEHELTKQQLTHIKRDLDSAKQNMSVYPKKTWLKIFGQKFVTIFTKFHTSDAVKEIAKETTKTFLIESIKNIT